MKSKTLAIYALSSLVYFVALGGIIYYFVYYEPPQKTIIPAGSENVTFFFVPEIDFQVVSASSPIDIKICYSGFVMGPNTTIWKRDQVTHGKWSWEDDSYKGEYGITVYSLRFENPHGHDVKIKFRVNTYLNDFFKDIFQPMIAMIALLLFMIGLGIYAFTIGIIISIHVLVKKRKKRRDARMAEELSDIGRSLDEQPLVVEAIIIDEKDL